MSQMTAAQASRQSVRHGDGTYAAMERAESDQVVLDAEMEERDRWGQAGVSVGSRTPWGTADHVDHPAPGVAVVSTPGHGGIKVSPERNAVIPPALRNRSGWYEEDCEAAIVGMYHPDLARARGYYAAADQERWAASCRETVKDWFPDAYMKATGETLRPEDSYTLLERAKKQSVADFRADHADEFVTLGNGDTHAAWIPDGYAVCKARMDATGEERSYLMPQDEVIHDGMYGRNALVDPHRHLDVTHIADLNPDRPWVYRPREVAPITGEALKIDYAGLTASQASRAAGELGKRYRFRDDDGTEVIETTAEHFARRGVVGKRPHVDGDKVTYSVMFEGSRSMRVSKAAYDALTGVPDTSDDTAKAYVARERARVRFERERAKFDLSEPGRVRRAKAEADYEQATTTYRTLSDAQSEQARAWQAERDQMRADAMRALLADKGLDLD